MVRDAPQLPEQEETESTEKDRETMILVFLGSLRYLLFKFLSIFHVRLLLRRTPAALRLTSRGRAQRHANCRRRCVRDDSADAGEAPRPGGNSQLGSGGGDH